MLRVIIDESKRSLSLDMNYHLFITSRSRGTSRFLFTAYANRGNPGSVG